MTDLLRTFEQLKDDMKNGQLPVDVATAETANEQHKALKLRLQATSIESLEIQARKVHIPHRLHIPGCSCTSGSWAIARRRMTGTVRRVATCR